MSIQKQKVVDLIEVTESGVVQIRESIRITEDNKVIAQSFERHVVLPGDDYIQESDRVKAICQAVHTASVVEAYQAAQSAQGV